ncbi:MAG: hypothetical protein P8O16_07630 [Algoriphagus sp.]|uniref:hypothetical protein n=1 Tax=Algoriphagus sp. TaxID=1872435 RepID=UPI002634BCC0|nr:hypothetical protein [Algoriphagus sp.]MDG1277135.1 hypothetical protein [Algoriphagus sp.]
MKKTVKILIAAVFAVAFGSLANAQSASISANATVISEISVTTQANLEFGTVVVGQTKSIDGLGSIDVSSGPTLGSSQLGRFLIEAQKGSNVQLTFALPTNLSTTGGALLPISFGPGVSAKSAIVELRPGYQTEFTPSVPYQISGFLNSAEPTDRYIQVSIGGKVDATSATAGSYTGIITLSAIYN